MRLKNAGGRADIVAIKTAITVVVAWGCLALGIRASEVVPVSHAEIDRLRSLPVVRIAVDRGNVEAALDQLKGATGLKLVVAPKQVFGAPVSLFVTGTPWDVMDFLQSTQTVAFTLEEGVWVARSPAPRFLRIYAVAGAEKARFAEVRRKLTQLQADDRTARLAYGPDQRTITVDAATAFHAKVEDYLKWVDSSVRTVTPLMAAVEGRWPLAATQFAQQD